MDQLSDSRQAGAEIEVTPAMVEAAKAALISWFEGCADFGDGALHILEAGMLARRKLVNVHAGPVGGCYESAQLG